MGNVLSPVPIITSAMIEDLTIIGADIQDRSIAAAKIVLNTLTSDEIGNLAITEAELGALAVTVGKIGALAVTEAKLGALAVTEAKIGALAVTVDKLAALSVSTAKIQDDAVTPAKLSFSPSMIVDTEVVTEACQSVVFSGLDINTRKFYRLLAVIKNAQASGSSYMLFINADQTHANYRSQYVESYGATLESHYLDEPQFSVLMPSESGICNGLIMRDPDGRVRATITANSNIGASFWLHQHEIVKTVVEANVTQIEINCPAGAYIGVGSVFVLL